jgi:hypothetical protein
MNGESAREIERRHALHRQIGALRAQLDRIVTTNSQRDRAKFFRLLNLMRRKEGALMQPRLPLTEKVT